MDNSRKLILIENMTNNLPVLRKAIGRSQQDLADRLGVTRQTISAIENHQREMLWTVFLSLLLLFARNQKTKRLLVVFEIYTSELNDYIRI